MSPNRVGGCRYIAGMSSTAFEQAMAAYNGVDAALDKLGALDCGALSNQERLALLQRGESWRRRLPAVEHQLVSELAHAPGEELGGRPAHVLADRLRIYRRDAARRIEQAADFGARTTLAGLPLPPRLEATAAGQRAGLIGDEHVKIIRGFFGQLPCWIDEPTRVEAEHKLA